MVDHDDSAALQARVLDAVHNDQALCIQGGGSKQFYGRQTERHNHPTLNTAQHSGIVSYQPTELTLTARAGTPLAEIRAALDEAGQMLPFDPPALDAADGKVATLGGTLACGLSGQVRPFAGSCRDYVLGVRVINGHAQSLRFGGEVMKNVAGYDLSRIMVGALGTFGVLLDASLKVLPKPAVTRCYTASCSEIDALAFMQSKRMGYLPLSGASYHDGAVHYRLAGAASAVEACARDMRDAIGGSEEDSTYWPALDEQLLPFFDDARPLWRLAVPPGTGSLSLPGDYMIDWGGQQRWLLSEAPAEQIQSLVTAAGGHATRFKRGDTNVFQTIPLAQVALHTRLKHAFDPRGVFNPGRLFEGA